MERAKQVVFVFAVVLLQIAFSHWWLARFRYGTDGMGMACDYLLDFA
jgi:hypothetical protein